MVIQEFLDWLEVNEIKSDHLDTEDNTRIVYMCVHKTLGTVVTYGL